jgi:hypothetical protein
MIKEAAKKYYARLHSDLLVIQRYIKNNVGVFITILYILGSFSGVIYLATLLNNFSVNVFHHIELSDFLFALISNPYIIAMYTICIFATVLSYKIEVKQISEYEKITRLKKVYYGLSYPMYLLNPTYSLTITIVVILSYFPYVHANMFSKEIKEEKTQRYHLSLNNAIQKNKKKLLDEVQIVASTTRNLFVYDNKQNKLLIISHDNIGAATPIVKSDNDVDDINDHEAKHDKKT